MLTGPSTAVAATPTAARFRAVVTRRRAVRVRRSSTRRRASDSAPLKPSSWSVRSRDTPSWKTAVPAAVRRAERTSSTRPTATTVPVMAPYWEGVRSPHRFGLRPTL